MNNNSIYFTICDTILKNIKEIKLNDILILLSVDVYEKVIQELKYAPCSTTLEKICGCNCLIKAELPINTFLIVKKVDIKNIQYWKEILI